MSPAKPLDEPGDRDAQHQHDADHRQADQVAQLAEHEVRLLALPAARTPRSGPRASPRASPGRRRAGRRRPTIRTAPGPSCWKVSADSSPSSSPTMPGQQRLQRAATRASSASGRPARPAPTTTNAERQDREERQEREVGDRAGLQVALDGPVVLDHPHHVVDERPSLRRTAASRSLSDATSGACQPQREVAAGLPARPRPRGRRGGTPRPRRRTRSRRAPRRRGRATSSGRWWAMVTCGW